CPDHWIGAGDRCYRVFTQETSWEKAEYNCMQHGYVAHLATVTSDEGNEHIVELSQIYQQDLWIGLNRRQEHSLFEWTSGKDVQYTNWAPGEPNSHNETEDCVITSTDFKWHDYSCSYTMASIC
ncbi:hypothetical protein CAPTEDRAFT_76348, partial [Capitella teleta]